MIEIICGVYGGKNGLKRPGDKPFSLSPAEEARLVDRKVARYVEQPEMLETEDQKDQYSDDDADGTPIGFGEIPPEDFVEDEAEVEDEIVDLETLTANKLRALGAEYGLTFKANAKRKDMIEKITEAQTQLAEDIEDAPTFDAAEAVEE